MMGAEARVVIVQILQKVPESLHLEVDLVRAGLYHFFQCFI